MSRPALVALLSCVGIGQASADPSPIDIQAVKDALTVATDGKGHHVLFLPYKHPRRLDFFLYGDGKKVFRQIMTNAYAAPKIMLYGFWEPRVTTQAQAMLRMRDGAYTLRCRDRETPLRLVEGAARKALLDGLKAYDRPWQRQAYALARDNRGVYYFVDRPRSMGGVDPAVRRTGLRLFIGPAGRLRLQTMKQVVADPLGEIFVTRDGKLRLILNVESHKRSALWLKGRRQSVLKLLPLQDSAVAFVYTDLGVYAGARLGTPCDDL